MARSSQARQWMAVLVVALLLGVGAAIVVRYVPTSEGTQVGMRAPDYRLNDLTHGDSINLRSRYRGHVTLISIWATWCHPCEKELPSMERLYQAYQPKGFRIAAASIDDGAPASVLEFATAHALTFDILQDRSGRIQQEYQTIGVPQSFLVDPAGRISYVGLGGESWDDSTHRAMIDQLLAQGR